MNAVFHYQRKMVIVVCFALDEILRNNFISYAQPFPNDQPHTNNISIPVIWTAYEYCGLFTYNILDPTIAHNNS